MGINLNAHGYAEAKTAKPGEFIKLPPGGYVCTVVNAEITYSKNGNPMLVLYLDIIEGEFKSYFADATKRLKSLKPDKRWDGDGIYRQNFYNNDGKVSPFFKYLLTILMKDNPNAKVNAENFEPDCFFNATIGFVFAEEVWNFEGRSGVRVRPKTPESVEDIRSGNFKVPELKQQNTQLATNGNATVGGSMPGNDDEDPPF